MAFDGTEFDTTITYLTDPPTANLTFTSYAAGSFTFTLSPVIYSTAINISSINVQGYSNTGCTGSFVQSDSNVGLLIIPPGISVNNQDGQNPMTSPVIRYKKLDSISVNGTTRLNGQTITIGGTTVTVVIDTTTCNVYAV
jgi:hypothetical protein